MWCGLRTSGNAHSHAGHLVVDASTAESDVGGERGGVVVRAEGRLTLGPVLHHKIQRSKTLEGEETRVEGEERRVEGEETRVEGEEMRVEGRRRG